MRQWLHHVLIRAWVQAHGSKLILGTMLSGGANSTISLFNSKLFGWKIFDMKLPFQSRWKIDRWRVLIVTICENIPQIIIQVLYTQFIGEFSTVVVIALISSVLSVVLVTGTCLLQHQMSNTKTKEKLVKQFRMTISLSKIDSKNKKIRRKLGMCFLPMLIHLY